MSMRTKGCSGYFSFVNIILRTNNKQPNLKQTNLNQMWLTTQVASSNWKYAITPRSSSSNMSRSGPSFRNLKQHMGLMIKIMRHIVLPLKKSRATNHQKS
jgi:hypothetical protein